MAPPVPAVSARGRAGFALEGPSEMRAFGKPAGERNLHDGQIRGLQQFARLVNAIAPQVGHRGDAQFLAKTIGQIVGTDANVPGDVLPGEHLSVAIMDASGSLPDELLGGPPQRGLAGQGVLDSI